MNFLLILLSGGILRKIREIISSKMGGDKNEGFTDKGVRKGGADGLGSGRRRYVRLPRGGGCRRGIHDCRGAAPAQRLRSDLRAIFGVKAAQPRRQCGGVHFADHSRLGSHCAAAAGDEAVFPARRAGAKRRAAECTAAFRGKRAFSALRLHIALAALNLVLWIFFLLPGVALAAGGIYMLLSSTVGILTIAAVLTGSILMLISGCIFCSGARQAWSAAEYILAADPDVSIKQALRQSRDIMRGHCRAFARFKAGFALWFLSCVLILPAFLSSRITDSPARCG